MKSELVNLKDLMIEQGQELYDATLLERLELPKIRLQATNPQLRKIIEKQLKAAKTQKDHLLRIFSQLQENPTAERNDCCQSVFEQTHRLLERSQNSAIRDAIIINAIQRLNHNKIASLGSMVTYARETGHEQIAGTMHDTLENEKAIDQDLAALAKKKINKKAAIAKENHQQKSLY